MQLSRRQFVSTTAVTGAALAADMQAGHAADAALPFIVVGDWGRRGHHDQRRRGGADGQDRGGDGQPLHHFDRR